jgi:ubiquinone/menaquinone biosynthesis C-methylase UbiE/uncharacterized protein YbaR (Trm112 family)
MRSKLADFYLCPATKGKLVLTDAVLEGDRVTSGKLKAGENIYEIEDGIPNFIRRADLTALEIDTQKSYDLAADRIYDAAIDWLFASFCANEDDVRESMIDGLAIKDDSKVLEVSCGTGRDSFRIARRLGKQGVFFVQDIASNMVAKTSDRFCNEFNEKYKISCEVNYFVSNATYLPFPDGYFDAVFHFGGFNTFGDQKATLSEFARITKIGGKVVVGDESLPPWLEGTTFGEIVCTNNRMFRHKAPLNALPACARNVVVRWILGECFYLIDFSVGEGEPPLNLDLPHQGRRGGSMRTRHFGQLEGVTLEAKKLAIEAAAKEGVSLHQWLDALVRQGARKSLG